MDHIRDPRDLSPEEIEDIEKQSLRWLFQAACDFGFDSWEIFYQSPDDVQDVAEDITREMLDRLGGYQIPRRILGNVDYRKARYIILPEFAIRQALFVDSKAEKTSRTATLQMSQVSMQVRQRRGGVEVAEQGKLDPVSEYENTPFLTSILLVHFEYEDRHGRHHLKHITLAAIPNGRLQDKYNPNPDDTIWRAGRNAPSRGEDFRVRLSFPALMAKAAWRVQIVSFDENTRTIDAEWSDAPRVIAPLEEDENGQV